MLNILSFFVSIQLAHAQVSSPEVVNPSADEVGIELGGNSISSVSGQDPEIRLPGFPARNTSQGAGVSRPTPPREPGTGSTPGRTNGNSMNSVGNSAFPGMSCPLVDNRPHQDLVKAVQNLARVVVVTPECQNNTDLTKMNEDVQKMMQVGATLVGYWNSPELLAQSGQSVGQFQSGIQDMITGINRVTQTLQNNSFINSNCGQELMTGTGLLVGVSDLVTAFAPFALIGAAMNPSLKIALPYILGITGAGSVAKIIKTMHDQNTLDMDRPEHRQAVLDNVCEFSKISQRVRFLQLVQSGQIDLITSELGQMSVQSQNLLLSEFGKRVFDIKKIHEDFLSLLSELDMEALAIRNQQEAISRDLKEASSELVCLITKELVDAQDPNQYPLNLVQFYKRVISRQQKPLVYQSTLIATEQRVRERLASSDYDDPKCSTLGNTYLQILGRMAGNGIQTIASLKRSLDTQVKEDMDYRAFSSREKVVMNEIEFLTKIKNLLTQLNLDNAVIDKLELDTRLDQLKVALFGTPRGLAGVRGNSPAMAWLDFAWTQHHRASIQFKREYDRLVRDAFAVSKSMSLDFFKRDQDGNILRDRWGAPIRKTNAEIDKLIIDDMLGSKTLQALTPAVAPKGSDNHVLICRRLENIWTSWAASVDHLSATQFFCDFISPFFDSRTEASIISRCEGRRDLVGRVVRHSEVSQRLIDMRKAQDKEKANIISSKLNELECPMPTAEALK